MGSTTAEVTAAASSNAGDRTRSRTLSTWMVVAALVGVGAYLRLANLGDLGFRWDEKYSSLAVKAILEHGIPELPAGMIYWRGTWFSYLMAESARLFGHSELALRLPAALFGVAVIPVAFVYGRALFGVATGLLLAGLLAVSPWDIELSRYARMYTPFTLFYLLTVYCIWRYRVQRESTAGGLLCLALAAVTLSLHQLGYTLALAFLFPVVIRGRPLAEPARLVFPIAASVIVAALSVGANTFLDYYRHIPIRDAADAGVADAAAVGVVGNLVADVLDLSMSALPDMPLLAALWERAPVLLVAFGAGAALALLGFRRRSRPTPSTAASGDLGETAAHRALLAVIVASAALQLFTVALLATALLAFRKRAGLAALRARDVRFALAFVVVAFGAWLSAGLAFDLAGVAQQGTAAAVRGTIRALLDFPHFAIFWGYPNEWPLASAVAAIGCAWAFDRAARRPPDAAALFSILALATPLVMNGLFDTEYEIFRYNVPFDTFFMMFVALGILRWQDLVPRLRAVPAHARLRSKPIAVGTALAVLLACGLDLNPARGFLITERDYRNDGLLYRWFGLASYPDYKTPAAFVAAAANDDDKVIASDSREYYDYIGRLDYWLRSYRYEAQAYEVAGRLKDIYLDTPLITSMVELEAVLRSPGTTWLIVSDGMLNRGPIDAEIRDFLEAQPERIVYVSRDGFTKVYRFDPPRRLPASTAGSFSAIGG